MKKLFTLTLAVAAVLTAGAAPAYKLGKVSRQANIEVKAAAQTAALPASQGVSSRADEDLSGRYVDGIYQVITSSSTGEDVGEIVSRGGGFTMVADPAVENGYIIKNLFETLFFDSSNPGTVNDIKAVYNPETKVFSINPGQAMFKFSDPNVGTFDIELITCDDNYYYDNTIPVEFTYDMGILRMKSPAVFFAAKNTEGYLTLNAYLPIVSAWEPNGEMKYYSYALKGDQTVPVYGVYTDGHIYVYNFADADPLNSTPFVRQEDHTKAVFRSIVGDNNYYAAAYIVQYYPSEYPDMNIKANYYLTEVEATDNSYTPVINDSYDFYLAGDIVTNTANECKVTFPDCGLYNANDGLWDIMTGCELTFDPSAIAGIENVAAEADNANAPVVYYNLQGMRVNNPQGGIFIRQQGNKSTKVLVK